MTARDTELSEVQLRLRGQLRVPASQSSVPSSLPVLFFGDASAARVATIGINPSKFEYLDAGDRLLTGLLQRLETTASLGVANRQELSAAHADQAIARMRTYFEPDKPVYGSYFRHLGHVLDGLLASYEDRSAAHLDLVQEATNPVWRGLEPQEKTSLLDQGVPFLLWQLEHLPDLTLALCTTATVGDELQRRLSVEIEHRDQLKGLKWWFGTAKIGGRILKVGGWNVPLQRPTGLGTAGEIELGKAFSTLL